MTEEKPTSSVILRGSALLTDLPADMAQIYTRVIRNFFKVPAPARRKGRGAAAPAPATTYVPISEATVLDEAGTATVTVEVPSREAAQRLHRRLQNAKVCGRRWKVSYAPAAAAQPKPDPCLLQCTLVPAASRALAERALAAVPGFLAFAELPPSMRGAAGEAAPRRGRAVGGDAFSDGEEEEEEEEEGVEVPEGGAGAFDDREELLLASFADEGCALHARAVLSGRLIGTSGVRMFLERRR